MAFDPISSALGASFGSLSAISGNAIVNQAIADLQRLVDTSPYMLLGDVSFSVQAYAQGDETRKHAEFAEHKLIGAKPRLQWVGDGLDEISWRVLFHTSFCNPEAEVQKLESLLASHAAAPLFMANGESRGTFVVTALTLTRRWTLNDGKLLCLEAAVDLKEYVAPPTPVTQSASQAPVAAQQNTATGAMNPPGTVTATATPRPSTAPITRN